MFSMILGKPAQYIGSQPTDSTAAKAALPGKPTDNCHARDQPWRSSRKTRHFMGREDLVPWRKRFVNPAGKENSLAKANEGCPKTLGVRLKRVFVHKRPATCGSGRLGSSCHLWAESCARCNRCARWVSLKIQRISRPIYELTVSQ